MPTTISTCFIDNFILNTNSKLRQDSHVTPEIFSILSEVKSTKETNLFIRKPNTFTAKDNI